MFGLKVKSQYLWYLRIFGSKYVFVGSNLFERGIDVTLVVVLYRCVRMNSHLRRTSEFLADQYEQSHDK